MHHAEVKEMEGALEYLQSCLQPLIVNCADWNIKDAPFEKRLAEFNKRLQRYRERMNKIYAKRLQDQVDASESEDPESD